MLPSFVSWLFPFNTYFQVHVEGVMELVELTTLRDALIGFPNVTELSTDHRKRLTIAVELVANPSIIFMDEPTTGLDAKAAAIVMRNCEKYGGHWKNCGVHYSPAKQWHIWIIWWGKKTLMYKDTLNHFFVHFGNLNAFDSKNSSFYWHKEVKKYMSVSWGQALAIWSITSR